MPEWLFLGTFDFYATSACLSPLKSALLIFRLPPKPAASKKAEARKFSACPGLEARSVGIKRISSNMEFSITAGISITCSLERAMLIVTL
jgi:hypothetical protein